MLAIFASTSMATHAVDELIEMEEKFDALDATTLNENGVADSRVNSPYISPPPPPVNQNGYKELCRDHRHIRKLLVACDPTLTQPHHPTQGQGASPRRCKLLRQAAGALYLRP